mgnify:CR=1 FL=1
MNYKISVWPVNYAEPYEEIVSDSFYNYLRNNSDSLISILEEVDEPTTIGWQD